MARIPQITYVKALLQQLVARENTSIAAISPPNRLMSMNGEGTIVLDSSENAEHNSVLHHLLHDFGRKEDVSAGAIEAALRCAIFFALDLSGQATTHISRRTHKDGGRGA